MEDPKRSHKRGYCTSCYNVERIGAHELRRIINERRSEFLEDWYEYMTQHDEYIFFKLSTNDSNTFFDDY